MKRHAAAAERNRGPIAEVLAEHLPKQGVVLEVASGTGQHVSYFAERFPDLIWQPTEANTDLLESITAWTAGLVNVRSPFVLNVESQAWPLDAADVLFNANLIHIAPWRVAEALFAGAGQLIPTGGLMMLYGPFNRDGQFTSESNHAFDSWLREQNATWGIRDLADVAALADRHNLTLEHTVKMPANNLCLVFKRR